MTSVRQLAGIRFETVAPPSPDVLPRMDVAAFVGFAAAGPLNLAVAVEDIPQFEEIFKADLAIARDPENHRTLYGYLAPCVRAFFRNGGKRCWVVRVAGERKPNRFAIQGLKTLSAPDILTPAYAWARSQGSWSDSLRVSAAAVRETIPLDYVSFSPIVIRVSPVSGDSVAAGDLLRIVGDTEVLWVAVEQTTTLASNTGGDLGVGAGAVVEITPGATYIEPAASPLESPLGASPFAERITMDLTVQDSDGNRWVFSGLGFAPKNPRYWAALPDDAAIFVPANAAADPAGIFRDLWNAAITPRFPLAGPGGTAVYIPLDLPISAPEESTADPRTETPLERDGLDDFDPRLFLDRAFDDVLTPDLLAQAEFVQYQSDSPRSLAGIHAALAIDEATLIAAPDAVQRGWTRDDAQPLPSPPSSSPIDRPDWWTFLDCTKPAARPRVTEPPGYGFLACDLPQIAPPVLSSTPATEDGTFQLQWTGGDPDAIDTLEEATDPGFASAEPVYTGKAPGFTITGHAPGDYFYRVQRKSGSAVSDYSNPLGVRVEPAMGWRVAPEDRYDDRPLLDIHRALVRMCAARGDLFAVLAMPEHYREQEALAHAARLRAPEVIGGLIMPLGFGEASSFSFGALYHPWLTGREEDALDDLRTNPPDGAITGVFAQRAAARGAWIAPANEPLRGVVALSPRLSRDSWQNFLEAQINLVRQEPGGFLTLASDTLQDDDDYRPINVRRLLSLLRRLVLRKGAEYVFEPNSGEFQRLVQRGFESLLEGMFLRGAFAGRVASDGFQVITDPSVNTAASVEQGRFITDLRIAPSVPLNFLRIRLVQTADRTSITEGK